MHVATTSTSFHSATKPPRKTLALMPALDTSNLQTM